MKKNLEAAQLGGKILIVDNKLELNKKFLINVK